MLSGNDVYRWNAVDVRDDPDTPVRHGFVVDTAAAGFLVDFTTTRQLIPFPHLRLCVDVQPTTTLRAINTAAARTTSDLLEALLRTPAGPRQWRPATLLCHRTHHFAFVEVRTPEGGVVREVVASDCVRTRVAWMGNTVRASDFVKQLVILPGDVAWREDVVGLWNAAAQQCRCMAVGRVEGRGVLVLRGRRRDCWNHVNDLYGKLAESRDRSWCLTTCAPEVMEPVCSINRFLSNELFLQIFGFLDTYEQRHLRRVCDLWNALLTSPSILQDIHLRLSDLQSGSAAHYHDMRRLATCVHRCVLPSGGRSLLVEGWGVITYGDAVIPILQMMLEACGYQGVRRLVLSTMMLTLDPTDLWTRVGAVCREGAVLRNVVLCYSAGMTQYDYYPVDGRVPVGPDVGRGLWKVVERSVGGLSGEEMERLTAWVRSDAARVRVVAVLEAMEKGGVMKGRRWTASDLRELDVRKLPKVMQYTLIKEMVKVPGAAGNHPLLAAYA